MSEPQAESSPTSSYISPSLPGMIRNLWKSDPSENSVRTALKLAGDLIQELIDLRAAPVQPSSTLDEGRLSEIIEDAIIDNLEPENTITGFYVPSGRVSDIASVAARAVVEAIGGEVR